MITHVLAFYWLARSIFEPPAIAGSSLPSGIPIPSPAPIPERRSI